MPDLPEGEKGLGTDQAVGSEKSWSGNRGGNHKKEGKGGGGREIRITVKKKPKKKI